MRYVLTLFCLTVLAASVALPQSAAGAAKKKTTTPSSTKKTAPTATKGASRPTAAARKTSASATKKGKTGRKVIAAAPARQMTPTPERYKEIQQALADKGYLKSEPTGVWDADSTEALKQFQTDKNLTPTGKITAPSLIGLGLGPRPADAGADPPPPPPLPAAAATTPASAN